MDVVTGALNTLLPKLAVLLTGEYRLQKSLRDDIVFLKDELESMQPALERLSEAPITDKQIRIWARDVRELSYDIEDSIDRFMVHLEANPSAKAHGFGGFIRRSLKLLTTARLRHALASDIVGIKQLVIEISSRRDRYKIENVSFVQPDNTTIDPRLMAFYKETTKLVGISGPQDELINELLMESDGTLKHCLKVISIVGVGGLGKTTLANVTYQHLREQFQCHAFVSVSLNPDLMRILCSMLRYFIILDDIWDKSAWNLLKCALIDNNLGSRIITTSRVLDVSASCCSEVHGCIYKLKPLSHDDSKNLFYRRLFGSEDSCHLELKEISERILRKCGGVPLAINTTASLLAGKPKTIFEWHSVHNSIGSGLVKNPNVEDMRKILSISYYGLPSHLKPCLLYLSIFPEDYTISKDQLIRRWISEGFIPGNDVVTLYEHGENYFSELINRSMIEPEYIDTSGRILDFRVHDMILDLITSLSFDENFVTILRSQQCTYMPNKIHRLSFQNSTDGLSMLKAMNLSHLRSLIIFPGATKLLPPLSSFHLLRVLDFEGCQDLDNNQVDGLVKLFHLRCLVLKDTNIAYLPKQIGRLRCLQILDVRNTRISVLPSSVVQLRELVRLHVDRSVMLPVGFGGMKSLQALSYVCVSKSPKFIKELGNLSELRILHISLSGTRHMNYEKSLIDSLCNLEKLHELFILGGQLSRLPRWISSSLLCLHKLDIKLNTLTPEDFQNLGAIVCLLDLCLMVLNDETERLAVGIDHGEFQCLVNLSFTSNAMRLTFFKQAMPRLENLELAFIIAETKDFDLGLKNLPSLKHATIRIDCWGSSVNEVERASAAIQMAAFLNINHPKLDVIRHFDNDLAEYNDVLNVQDEINGIYEEIVVDKMGPRGGTGGVVRGIKVASCHLESVTICSGTIIDAIAFSYRDRKGNHHTTQFWGGTGGSANTICLGTSEFLREVSGTVGPFFSIPNAITSLRLVSNLRSYGPFGVPQGTPFCGKVK
ncbi:unnamed protein product [Urochloa decumbens]|uniref:Jacalin-type lectin domain-containing protein n=1 Tax=Urochloa decumbens TaxID=240449 RepID=A0ABC9H723_9POAL